MKKIFRSISMALVVLSVLTGCGGGGQAPPIQPPPQTDLVWDQGNWDQLNWQ